MSLSFRVYGIASGMGSKKAFLPKGWTRPIVTDSNRNLKAWQSLVAEAANHALAALPANERELLRGPVRLTLAFYLPRPQSLSKKVTAHIKAPDCSKLIRSTEDAMTGVVYADDRQVVEIVAGKFYAAEGRPPHVDVRVEATAGVDAIHVPAAPLPLFEQSSFFAEVGR